MLGDNDNMYYLCNILKKYLHMHPSFMQLLYPISFGNNITTFGSKKTPVRNPDRELTALYRLSLIAGVVTVYPVLL